MRCDECKHWNKAYQNQVQSLIVGQCTRAMPFWDASEWSEELSNKNDADGLWNGPDRVLKPEFADRKFFAQDGSDYMANVLTAPDFFCAEFSKP